MKTAGFGALVLIAVFAAGLRADSYDELATLVQVTRTRATEAVQARSEVARLEAEQVRTRQASADALALLDTDRRTAELRVISETISEAITLQDWPRVMVLVLQLDAKLKERDAAQLVYDQAFAIVVVTEQTLSRSRADFATKRDQWTAAVRAIVTAANNLSL
ncbi:MAG TPA: hypothetical protein VJL59_12260 [Anaerolineales bacterium]|nr:hypothetical protein [Anaerolineales bacterium]